MNKNIIIVIVGVFILALGISMYSSNNSSKENLTNRDMMQNTDSVLDQQKEESVVAQTENDLMIKEDTSTPTPEANAVMKVGSYEAYAPEKISQNVAGDVVLFFHASWCPSCRALNADIEKNLSSIPEGVSILKVDYDKETELKKKYSVTTQHTLVQVDKNANLIKKWSGSPKLENIISEIQ